MVLNLSENVMHLRIPRGNSHVVVKVMCRGKSVDMAVNQTKAIQFRRVNTIEKSFKTIKDNEE